MFTLEINGWNIIMEVWFRSFSPVKICRFHGHLPECRSYSGVSLCFTISGLYQDILRYKDDDSLSGSLLTDQHIQQKCNQVVFHPSLGRAKVKCVFFCVAHVTKTGLRFWFKLKPILRPGTTHSHWEIGWECQDSPGEIWRNLFGKKLDMWDWKQ